MNQKNRKMEKQQIQLRMRELKKELKKSDTLLESTQLAKIFGYKNAQSFDNSSKKEDNCETFIKIHDICKRHYTTTHKDMNP